MNLTEEKYEKMWNAMKKELSRQNREEDVWFDDELMSNQSVQIDGFVTMRPLFERLIEAYLAE